MLVHSNHCEGNLLEQKIEVLSEHLQRGKRKKLIKAFFRKKYKDTYLLTWPTGHAQFVVFFFITDNKVTDETRNDSLFIWPIGREILKNCPNTGYTKKLPKCWLLPCLFEPSLAGKRLCERPFSWHNPNWSIFFPFHFPLRTTEKLGQLY